MIVDLERNDLSRIARPGSVTVDGLFEVEAYPTVLQLVSTVRAEVADGVRSLDVLKSIFPCGSVTGAPKIRAMEIIAALEGWARGVYTGAIGHIAPDGDAAFSVPIRTLVIADGIARMGIGSGVVADSDGPGEWDESLLKAAFLEDPKDRPSLIETLLWERAGGHWLLDQHLDRLRESAAYFVYPFDDATIRDALALAAESYSPDTDQRVRLLLAPSGEVSVTAAAVDVEGGRAALRAEPPTVAWAAGAVNSANPYLAHKTTRRGAYDRALKAATAAGHWDLLFVNERGEVTEGARSTLFLHKDGRWLTPPVSSGLLPGVFRRHFMTGTHVEVRPLTPDDVRTADRVCLANAVWGMVDVRLDEFEFDF
jgi:para-aminobenzoate synthetase/4-amino-4-deoxychorismate lyase